MERERLTQLLKAPGQVAREDLADLRSLAERYPWFSGAHVLRASGEGMAGDVLSDETLSTAAAHVPSRAVLYDLAASGLHDPPVAAPLSVVEKAEDRPEVIAEPPLLSAVKALPAPVVLSPRVEETQETEYPAAITVPDSLHPEKPAHAQGISEAEGPLERQIMEAALASAYDLTLHAPLPPLVHTEALDLKQTSTPEDEPHGRSTDEVVMQEPEVPQAALEAKPAEEPAPRPAPAVPISRNTRKRFSSWLDLDASTNAGQEVASTPEAPSAKAPASPAPKVQGPVPEKVLAPEERMSIVDRFIGQEIQAPAPKTAFFTPQQAAKRSLDDTAGMVTETLARIYAKQGNTAKAIEAYHKLALKYPEKSTYFAGLSQALEAQQNK